MGLTSRPVEHIQLPATRETRIDPRDLFPSRSVACGGGRGLSLETYAMQASQTLFTTERRLLRPAALAAPSLVGGRAACLPRKDAGAQGARRGLKSAPGATSSAARPCPHRRKTCVHRRTNAGDKRAAWSSWHSVRWRGAAVTKLKSLRSKRKDK